MNIFSLVKSHVSILDVVGEYTQLKKAGLYWKATCPFHSEKDASFTVSPHKGIFYCFGCHAGGDVISFIERIEQCTPLEAAKFLSERYHIEIPADIEWDKKELGGFEEKEHYFKLCEAVAQWALQELLKSEEALEYLIKRGIDKTSIKDYRLGYFPGGQRGVNGLLKTIKKHNIMPHDLMEVHIITEAKGYMYSPFEQRILFPIRDHLGRYCGFGGRIFKPHDERAKYYNSRENTYFQKGKLIFGLDLAKSAIKKSGELFLVEGYTDCIAMRQQRFDNVVATLGTACTLDHLQAFSRYCDRIVILYDSDQAGQQAIMRLAELCWQADLELSVVSLPEGDDPASLIAKGGDLKALIAESKDIFEFFLETIGKDFQARPLGEKVACVRKIISIVANINDGLKRAFLLQKAAAAFAIPPETLEFELKNIRMKYGKTGRSDVHAEQRQGLRHEGGSSGASMLEKKIFFAIMSNIQIFNSDNEGYLLGYFSEPLRSILEALQKAKTDDPALDFGGFFDQLNKDDQLLVSGVMLECDQEIEGKRFEDLLDQFKRKHWKRLVRAIKIQMDAGHDKTDSKDRLLNDFLMLKKKIFNKDRT